MSVKPFRRVVRGSPAIMLSMDVIATHHMVLGVSILPDLAAVSSCCNGLTVTLEPSCERCQGESGSVKLSRRAVRDSPCHMLSMDIVATHRAVLGISILPDFAAVRTCFMVIPTLGIFLFSEHPRPPETVYESPILAQPVHCYEPVFTHPKELLAAECADDLEVWLLSAQADLLHVHVRVLVGTGRLFHAIFDLSFTHRTRVHT